MKKLALILGLALTVSSCSSSKVVKGKEVTVAEEVSESAKIINKTLAQKSTFKNLTINAKLAVDLEDIGGDVKATIVVDNGSKIWVNATKLLFPLGRAQFTPEGFAAYEKIGGTYYEGDFSLANKLLKVDFIDYQKLQNLLLGKVFVDLNSKDYTADFKGNQYLVTYNKNASILATPVAGEYVQTYTFDKGFRLVKALLIDPKRKMEVEIEYKNWVKVGAEEFPKNVKIIIKDKKTRQVDLEYNSFTYQETNTPFSIPSGYKKKEIK